jgi:hypothetical protein
MSMFLATSRSCVFCRGALQSPYKRDVVCSIGVRLLYWVTYEVGGLLYCNEQLLVLLYTL